MYSGKIAVPPGGGWLVAYHKTLEFWEYYTYFVAKLQITAFIDSLLF
jgi:hypothetical protein